jgi:lipopolysaccharide/colanic/teichoic acid biosynthesis glycosyltransferase
MQHRNQIAIKYALDRLFALFLIIILSPIWVAIMIAIKLDDGGSVFFTQDRLGKDASIFQIYKFRTMIEDADRFLDEKGQVTTQNRITPVGKFLRALSLDELPQLLNILKGEMSVIGPRPVLPFHLPRYTPEQKRRLLMKPGVTGLAQVNGRNTLKWSQRIAYDVWYIDHYSLWLDVKILIKTVKVVFLREGIVLDRNPHEVDDLAPHPSQHPTPDTPHDTTSRT